LGVFLRRVGQDGVAAIGMLAADKLGAWERRDFEALGAQRHSAIWGDLDGRAQTPDIRPPRATGFGAQNGAALTLSQGPGLLGGHGQLAVFLVEVVVLAELSDPRVGVRDVDDAFGGEKGGEAILPEKVKAFDLTFGMRGRCVKQGDVVKLQGPAQLREGVRLLSQEEAVTVDVERQWQTVLGEGGGQQIEVGQEHFALIELGAGNQARAVVEQVQ
jgi:hypothetical protein